MGDHITARASRFQRWQHRLTDTPATLEADARTAFDSERFYLLYQPRMTCADREIRVVEALLRWQDSTRGDLHPGIFLSSLAQTAVMGELGRWVVRAACAQASEWERTRPSGEPPVAVGVNVTADDLLHDGFAESVTAAAEATGLRTDLLQLELDARTGVELDAGSAARLDRLRRSGISVTLDGVGPPLPADATSLVFDSINVDRRWVRRLGADRAAEDGIAALVAEAHARSLTVTAIGVETQSQADVLTTSGVDQIQGYFISEPVPPIQLGWQNPADSRRGPRRATVAERAARGRAARGSLESPRLDAPTVEAATPPGP